MNGNVAYFMHWNGETFSYDSSSQRWSELPDHHHWDGSLAVIRGLVTAIGGLKGGATTNKLLSMVNNEWVECFPPVPTKRYLTSAVSTKEHVIVAGGESESDPLDTVEVLDIETLVWSTAASLPHPYSRASATICGNQLYVLGGWDKSGDSKLVLTSSLANLVQSCNGASYDSVWHRTADVPVYYSTCAAVNGALVAIGGMDTGSKPTTAVHKYNPTTNSWDVISNMPTACHHCLVVVLPTNDVMVACGDTGVNNFTDKIEIADLIL